MGHQGYGEPGSSVLFCNINKPHVTKGMQTIIISDVHRNQLRGYTHCHNVHKPYLNAKQEGWTPKIPLEVVPSTVLTSKF